MKLHFFGAAQTVTGSQHVLEVNGRMIMLDCGTGAREMGLALQREFEGRPVDVAVFVGHTHWDHIQGFPFFMPAYVAGTRLTIHSLRGSDKSLEKVFTGQMDSSYFPVATSDLMARLQFVELDGTVKLGDAKVSHVYLNHPGLAIGFRIDIGKKSVVYISDHEPYHRLSGEMAVYSLALALGLPGERLAGLENVKRLRFPGGAVLEGPPAT